MLRWCTWAQILRIPGKPLSSDLLILAVSMNLGPPGYLFLTGYFKYGDEPFRVPLENTVTFTLLGIEKLSRDTLNE